MLSFVDMDLEAIRNFAAEQITDDQLDYFERLSRKVRRDVVKMTTTAGSGHLGGALSVVDIYMVLWLCAKITPQKMSCPERDRIVVSCGHTAAAVYSVLGNLGFFDIRQAVSSFRRAGSMFQGHVDCKVPGVEWCSGSLGQGLSVGCGFALADRLRQQDCHVFVVMGDGEQQKGQIAEARDLATKYGLNRLTAIIDCNGKQASGNTQEIMPQDISKQYAASNWKVHHVNGHNYRQIYHALKLCNRESDAPSVILAETVMGRGVPAIENNHQYHGQVLSGDQYQQAMNDLSRDEVAIPAPRLDLQARREPVESKVQQGTPVAYEPGRMIDCRSAFGTALHDIVAINRTSGVPVAVIDCDLAESVRTQGCAKDFPDSFIECGIQEHNAASMAGSLSSSGVLTFLAEFGVFGIDETYGQHRMNDVNATSLKLICTHVGLDVGEDGKTHQCIDYVSLVSNLFGYKLIIPADANQTDRAVRYVATTPGNFVVAMGRSKVPVLTDRAGQASYPADIAFQYGQADWLRKGHQATIITCGNMAARAVQASDSLNEEGIEVGVLNLACPTDLDRHSIARAAQTGLIVNYEDHHIRTGIGSIVGAFLAENRLHCRFRRMGITQYGVSASAQEQYRLQSLDIGALVETITTELN